MAITRNLPPATRDNILYAIEAWQEWRPGKPELRLKMDGALVPISRILTLGLGATNRLPGTTIAALRDAGISLADGSCGSAVDAVLVDIIGRLNRVPEKAA